MGYFFQVTHILIVLTVFSNGFSSHVPSYCDSLPHYETSSIFGRTFLRLIYATVQRQLMERFQVFTSFHA